MEECYWRRSGDADNEPPWRTDCGVKVHDVQIGWTSKLLEGYRQKHTRYGIKSEVVSMEYCPFCGKPIFVVWSKER